MGYGVSVQGHGFLSFHKSAASVSVAGELSMLLARLIKGGVHMQLVGAFDSGLDGGKAVQRMDCLSRASVQKPAQATLMAETLPMCWNTNLRRALENSC